MRGIYAPGACAAMALLSGCASIVGGHNQSLSVETQSEGKTISGANCTLNNDKGTWYVTTPGSVVVNRSYSDLSVKCQKDAFEPALTTVKSSTKPMAFGNILFGGVIGAAVDVSTGAAYDYPALISVALGAPTGTVGAGAAPLAPLAPIDALRAWERLEFRLVDRDTGASRPLVVAKGSGGSGPVCAIAGAGDMDLLAPPGGWAPEKVEAGTRWSAKYHARDATPGSALDLQAQAGAMTKLHTPGGSFDVVPIVYSGWADRSAGHANLVHAAEFKAWYAPTLQCIVQFESDIRVRGSSGALISRPSKERVELTRVHWKPSDR